MNQYIGFNFSGSFINYEKFYSEEVYPYFIKLYRKKNSSKKTLKDIKDDLKYIHRINELDIFDCANKEVNDFWTMERYLKLALSYFNPGVSKLLRNLRAKGKKIAIFYDGGSIPSNPKKNKLDRVLFQISCKIHGIEFDLCEFLNPDDDRVLKCKELGISIMVESRPKEAETMINNGIYTVCLKNGDNGNLESHEKLTKVKNFKEMETAIAMVEAEFKTPQILNIPDSVPGVPSNEKKWKDFQKDLDYSYPKPAHTIDGYLFYNNQNRMNKVAMSYFGRKYTYNNLNNKIIESAKALTNLGVTKDSVVTIIMPNTPEALAVFYAVNRLGAIANMLHPTKTSENEICGSIKAVKSKVVIAYHTIVNKIESIIDDTEVEHVATVSVAESMPLGINKLYVTKNDKKIKYPVDKRFKKWQKVVDCSKDKNYTAYPYEKDRTAVLLRTGGTEGEPKEVALTNDNFNYMVYQYRISVKSFEVGDRMLSAMPIFHGFGLGSCIHMPMCFGVEAVLLPLPTPKFVYNAITKRKINHIIAVPTVFEGMLSYPKYKGKNFPYFKNIGSGGDSLNGLEILFNNWLEEHRVSIKKWWVEKCNTPIKISKGYGLSEMVAGGTFTYENCNVVGDDGIPLPLTDMKIMPTDLPDEIIDGNLPENCYNEPGEIWFSGPTIMKEYYNNPNETKRTLIKDKDGKIWLRTGDLGFIRPNGTFKFLDRKKFMFLSGGFNVYPSRIMKTILKHPAVKDCLAVSAPHRYKKFVPVAYIVLNDGYEDTNEIRKEIYDLCVRSLDEPSVPYLFEFIDEIPLTKLDKKNRVALSSKFTEEIDATLEANGQDYEKDEDRLVLTRRLD